MLKIQKYIKQHGLQKTIEDFKLIHRDYGHKFLLKYDQIHSTFGIREVEECRGLILESGTLDIMCLSFYKFYNHGEGHAAKIDWNTASVLEKMDGSCLSLYYDPFLNEWCTATTGTANGEGLVNNKHNLTFSDLFKNTVKKCDFNFNDLNTNHIYVFELCTPYNIIVTPHSESSATLLTIRDRITLKEFSYNDAIEIGNKLNVPVVKRFNFKNKNVGELLRTFDNMPWSEEGYVVVDAKHNRIKIKNPKYLVAHHLKDKLAEHNIVEIVKSNEIEEFVSTFTERKEELYKLKENYDKLIRNLNDTWNEIKGFKPKNITKEERKKFAQKVFEISGKNGLLEFTGLFFGLQDKRAESVEVFMKEYDNKKLYLIL